MAGGTAADPIGAPPRADLPLLTLVNGASGGQTYLVSRGDVAVIGGGPAGLQAALTLGRMHVRTVLFDDGRYRNGTSPRMQNVLGQDGTTPANLRTTARSELAQYPWVRTVSSRVTAASGDGSGFKLISGTGDHLVSRLLLASGVTDTLLPIPGVAELWGDVVLPCPYCHGHEFADGPIAVISSGGHAEHVGGLLRGIAGSVPVVRPENVRAVTRSADGVVIDLTGGGEIEAACVFIPPNAVPRVELAASLGVTADRDGILVDALGRTSRPGVWAAGDVARRVDPRIPASVVTAMASGLTAAADISADVAVERDRRR